MNGSGSGRFWGAAAMVTIAAVAAVLSYFDGLFVAQLAGNHDWRAYLYPLLPDQLIVICLIALLAAAKRPAWASFGLVLGIALTLAMNVGAGIAHSTLDAVVDGFVPVVFFVAVEVFIGYVRRGRALPKQGTEEEPETVPVAVPVGAVVKPGLPSVRELRNEHACGPATEKKIRRAVRTRDAQWAQAIERSRGGGLRAPRAVPAAEVPASDRSAPQVLAGASLNGQAHGG